MQKMYCGNNANYTGLATGTHFLGTNYQCLRRGIGIGSHLPYDDAFAQQYAPVDPRRFYCGNAVALPGGYFATGSPSKCIQVGVGVGKSQRAGLGPPAFMYFIRYVLPYVLFFVLAIAIFLIVYFTKPKFLRKKDDNGNYLDKLDYSQFIPYFIVVCLLIAIFIYFFWKRFVRRWI